MVRFSRGFVELLGIVESITQEVTDVTFLDPLLTTTMLHLQERRSKAVRIEQ